MEYEIKVGVNAIDFGASGVQEVLQNISMILETPAFSCAMNRDFAWTPDMLDEPINIMKARIKGSVVEAIQKYEPRAEITSIDFETDALNGKIIPVVRVRMDESSI